MDTLTASSVSSRPWVLQFFRNLFGSRHVTQEGEGPKANAKESKDDKSELLDTEATLPGKGPENNTSPNEIHEGVMDSCAKELSEMKHISLGDTIPTDEKKLSLCNPTGLEMGDSEGFADSMTSNLAQDQCEKALVSGEKKRESSGDRGTVGKDEIASVLCVDNEEVSMATGGIEDCSAEDEREHLLKEDVGAEPPKAELSPWNRLVNMYKQRRRLHSSKVPHLQDIPAQPETEDEATLDLMIYGFATPKFHVDLSDSPGTTCVCGLPENEAMELVDHCEAAQGDSRPNDDRNLEHPKNLL
ncbi:uncharacterized protein LOC128321925 isoform X2 [Hemicordylus capensis]|uniref:uncharacterized protein LOC128321925 isoform X2 n=1 Tax=Hemicordylus capensis TaxID=884348 RepID=UPI0023044B73|nr:uncharacterized protein LOC128321925 isoform X2 [Hemicordylus capensis]